MSPLKTKKNKIKSLISLIIGKEIINHIRMIGSVKNSSIVLKVSGGNQLLD